MTAAFSGALEALRNLLSGVPGLGWVAYAPYAFRPFVLVVVLALVVGPVSTIVNLRRLEFNAEAMVHSVFPGVVAAAVWWAPANYVPAVAVIRRARALSGIIGRKGLVGGWSRLP